MRSHASCITLPSISAVCLCVHFWRCSPRVTTVGTTNGSLPYRLVTSLFMICLGIHCCVCVVRHTTYYEHTTSYAIVLPQKISNTSIEQHNIYFVLRTQYNRMQHRNIVTAFDDSVPFCPSLSPSLPFSLIPIEVFLQTVHMIVIHLLCCVCRHLREELTLTHIYDNSY